MKKSLIALAAVAATGAAFAQSSVTLFGVVDEAVSYAKGAESWNGINSGGNMTSRLGFRGTEDLGNGLKATFWLEGGLTPDNGGADSGYSFNEDKANRGFAFKRRSTIGLEGSFGEVRLGRELTQAYSATSRYDVFGQVGYGVSRVWADGGFNANARGTSQRVSNMVTYLSPNFSGFKVGVNYGFGEKAASSSDNRYIGAGLTYDNGPLSLGLSGERQNNSAVFEAVPAAQRDVTAWALGGSYNFGVAKLAAAYRDSKAKHVVGGAKDKMKSYYIGVSAPVGAAGEVKASYNHYEGQAAGADKLKANQFALGYVHNMSKRTAVYGTYAYLKNKNNDGANLGIELQSGAGVKGNGSSQGIQVGVRHSF